MDMRNSLQLCDSVMTYDYTLHNALVQFKCLNICMKLNMCVHISKESTSLSHIHMYLSMVCENHTNFHGLKYSQALKSEIGNSIKPMVAIVFNLF